MLKVAIVEDDANSSDLLVEYLNQYQRTHNSSFEYMFFETGEEIIKNYDVSLNIIFMDIDMPVMDGMEAARGIRSIDTDVAIVFVTNIAHYAINGYEVGALDFILKPLSYDSFEFKMNRIMRRLKKNSDTIILTSNDTVYKVAVSDIQYVEISHHTLTYYTTQLEIKVRGSMKEAEDNLRPHGFRRCDSCYLINLRCVTKIEDNYVYLGTIKLHISRARKKELIQALSKYVEMI